MDGVNGSSGKRSHSHYGSESTERNGPHKRRNQSRTDGLSDVSRATLDDIIYRVLCPSSKVGSVIGKGGSIIKSLRQETGAKIKIEDGIPGVDERVISIATAAKDRGRGGRANNEVTSDSEAMNDAEAEDALAPVQDALLRVFGCIVEGDSFSDEEEDGSRSVTARLLVPHSQIGCLLGKGGKVIEMMRTDTGAQIRILPSGQLPGCASPSDELVQIAGEWANVKKALHAVGSKLYENPPKDKPQKGTIAGSRPAAGNFPPVTFLPQSNSFLSSLSTVSSLGTVGSGAGSWPYSSQDYLLAPSLSGTRGSQKDIPEEEFVIRILCPDEKIGSIIGRGGSLIRQLREETRAKIKIEDAVPNSDERVITVSSKEAADAAVSPTLEAMILLQQRISDLTSEKDDDSVTTRLLVPSSSIGCLLGRGGSVITEMRKTTRANIRITHKESLPKCASESDELVMIMGDLIVARDALVQVVTKLRNNLFKEFTGNGDFNKRTSRQSELGYQVGLPSATNYQRLNEPRSPEALRHYSTLGAEGGIRSSYGNLSGSWAYQGGDSAALGGLSLYGSGASQNSSLLGRSGKSSGSVGAKVAGTTLEILIPSSAVGAVIGKGGGNIAHIREISGAKVKLRDGKPGASERTIEISGTPEQTQAAQSLLEAFLLSVESQDSLGGGLY